MFFGGLAAIPREGLDLVVAFASGHKMNGPEAAKGGPEGN